MEIAGCIVGLAIVALLAVMPVLIVAGRAQDDADRQEQRR